MRKLLARFNKDEKGATAIEYGLIAALMSVIVIAAITSLDQPLRDSFGGIADRISNPSGGAGGAGDGG